MSLSHNSTLSKSEPIWSSVDKNHLPNNAFARPPENPPKKAGRGYPHHHVEGGKIGGKHSIYVSGTMYLNKGGLKAALQAVGGARSGKKETNPAIKRHLVNHADVIGMDRKETAALLNMSIDSLMDFLNNNNINDNNKMGGENIMGMTYEELEAKVKNLEKTVSEKDAIISTMKTDAETLATTVKTNTESLESEIAKYEKSEGELNDKIDDFKTAAKDNKIYIEAGKTAIEDMKAEINKISAQVDGKGYNKELVDAQLIAFGTDISMLTQFKQNLETRRAKLFKTGEINPDEYKTEKTSAQEEYALGQKIGQGNVIPIK